MYQGQPATIVISTSALVLLLSLLYQFERHKYAGFPVRFSLILILVFMIINIVVISNGFEKLNSADSQNQTRNTQLTQLGEIQTCGTTLYSYQTMYDLHELIDQH